MTIAHNKSLIYNYDLAVSGAVIDNNIVANPGFQYDLAYQVSLFKQIYANKGSSASWDPWNSVFGIFIGINELVSHPYLHPRVEGPVRRLLLEGEIVGGSIFSFFLETHINDAPLSLVSVTLMDCPTLQPFRLHC